MSGSKERRVVVMGGGTGTFGVLIGLKYLHQVSITAICTAFDNGGYTGVQKDEHGLVLPAGDLRQALVALMPINGSDTLRELLAFRFPKRGDDPSCSLGNQVILAAEQLWGPVEGLRRIAKHVLHITDHDVYPTSIHEANLVAELSDGSTVVGETNIDKRNWREDKRTITKLYLDRDSYVLRETAEALEAADLIVLGPGDLYTSVLPNLVVKGVREAIRASKARVVIPINLMTKASETPRFTAQTFVDTFAAHGVGAIDAVLVNTGTIPDSLLERYLEQEGSCPVRYDAEVGMSMKSRVGSVIEANFVSRSGLQKGIIRHDSTELARSVMAVLEQAR